MGIFSSLKKLLFVSESVAKSAAEKSADYVKEKAEDVIDKAKDMAHDSTEAIKEKTSGLKEGDWLLITAGASAFGKLAIQMAHQKGIKVACTVRRDEQKEMLQDIGADLVINTEKEKLQKVIAEHTGEGVSVVFDAVGGILGAKAIASLKTGGKMMVFGLLSLENIPLNSGLLIFKNLKVEGFWLTTYMESLSAEQRKTVFKTVFTYLLSNKVKVDVQDSFPLEQFKEALEAYEQGGRNGKVLLVSK